MLARYPVIERELDAAWSLARQARWPESFRHLERAHILGQTKTVQHVRVHWAMLRWAWRRKDRREIIGQALRMFGATLGTPFGLIPLGNTGGAKVSPFRPMPIPEDLKAMLPVKRGKRT
jgi:hypothetical protein